MLLVLSISIFKFANYYNIALDEDFNKPQQSINYQNLEFWDYQYLLFWFIYFYLTMSLLNLIY